MKRILIAEDEARISSFIEKGLRANGFDTTVADDGRDALRKAESGEFDLLLLDVRLPGMDGFAILSQLRRRGRTIPVIMLTARDSVEDTVAGLEGGADDYISKPFRFDELLARIRARLRETPVLEPAVLQVGDASLDIRSRALTVGPRTVELTAREFALAEVFFRHPGEVLSREFLLGRAWGYDGESGSNVLEVYVRYLRQKLGEGLITTVRGVGYRLESEAEPARRT
jgi:two-component system copper resistance phosphate regulon response regulator CusR